VAVPLSQSSSVTIVDDDDDDGGGVPSSTTVAVVLFQLPSASVCIIFIAKHFEHLFRTCFRLVCSSFFLEFRITCIYLIFRSGAEDIGFKACAILANELMVGIVARLLCVGKSIMCGFERRDERGFVCGVLLVDDV